MPRTDPSQTSTEIADEVREVRPLDHFRPSDGREIAQLAVLSTEGVTRIVEEVHRSVVKTMGLPVGASQGTTSGVTGLVYRSIRGVTRMVGFGLDGAFAALQPITDLIEAGQPETPERDVVLAAANGILGDRLSEGRSRFAIPMAFRFRGRSLRHGEAPQVDQVTDRILILIHGLCMSDHQWRARRGELVVDHGDSVAEALGATTIHLRYNSGLHVSQNGRELASRLEQLVAAWPTPVADLTVVAHSMGGLVIRSACHYASEAGLRWPARLANIVFLGTPHHGAALEQAGNWVDQLLAATPFTAPFARLGHLRSAGITDLRRGNLLDEDWRGRCRFQRAPDLCRVVPLPQDVACFTVAAMTSASRGMLADHVGDGLVPISSALGIHDDPRRTLRFPEESQHLLFRTSHLGLLSHPDLSKTLIRWLRR